jgi:hypothetical protein
MSITMTKEELEKRLWQSYKHGHEVAQGISQGPDPLTQAMPDDPSQPGNPQPVEQKPMSRQEFIKSEFDKARSK